MGLFTLNFASHFFVLLRIQFDKGSCSGGRLNDQLAYNYVCFSWSQNSWVGNYIGSVSLLFLHHGFLEHTSQAKIQGQVLCEVVNFYLDHTAMGGIVNSLKRRSFPLHKLHYSFLEFVSSHF